MWQLTIDANDPQRLTDFWAEALGYEHQPPPDGHPTWKAWYAWRGVPAEELADLDDDHCDRLQDPTGAGPRIWFQIVPETKPPGAKNRLHLDLYPAGREAPAAERRAAVEAKVATLVGLGATVLHRHEDELSTYVTLQDPEGNEFCVS